MEPKFQSSFIPKGPATTNIGSKQVSKIKERGLTSFLAAIVFFLSLAAALGAFGYKFYLNRSIGKMGAELEEARATLAAEPIDEFIQLNNRIVATGEVVAAHVMLSPFFDFLESSTVQLLRFTGATYTSTDSGPSITLTGASPSYATLALQADIFNKSGYFRNPVFSGLNLDERGNVTFTFTAQVDPSLLSYTRFIESSQPAPAPAPSPAPVVNAAPEGSVDEEPIQEPIQE